MMFKKILVPLDGSELAEWALMPALKLAAAAQAELILLRSTISMNITIPIVADGNQWTWSDFAREQMRSESREYLRAVWEKYEPLGLKMQIMDVEGDAASMIVDTAVDKAVDLIVMSTHGWSGFKKWILGSVTERVLHSTPCPVLITRCDRPIERMVITLDGSPLSEKVIEPALAVAAGLKASVTLLRINETLLADYKPSVQFDWKVGQEINYEMGHPRCHEMETYLHAVTQRTSRHGLAVQWSVVAGQPATKILEFVNKHSIALIAMSTHGRSGLQRWLFGSVTAKVMHSFTGHMLIVRPSIRELI